MFRARPRGLGSLAEAIEANQRQIRGNPRRAEKRGETTFQNSHHGQDSRLGCWAAAAQPPNPLVSERKLKGGCGCGFGGSLGCRAGIGGSPTGGDRRGAERGAERHAAPRRALAMARARRHAYVYRSQALLAYTYVNVIPVRGPSKRPCACDHIILHGFTAGLSDCPAHSWQRAAGEAPPRRSVSSPSHRSAVGLAPPGRKFRETTMGTTQQSRTSAASYARYSIQK